MNAHVSVWLDLEDTVIEPVIFGWQNTPLMNIAKIQHALSTLKPHSLNVFSFAIWDQAQLLGFNTHVRKRLEDAFGMPLSVVPTVDDHIIQACKREMKIATDIDFSDMSDFWGKAGSFRHFIADLAKTHPSDVWREAILIDDVVDSETFELPQLRLRGKIINVDRDL